MPELKKRIRKKNHVRRGVSSRSRSCWSLRQKRKKSERSWTTKKKQLEPKKIYFVEFYSRSHPLVYRIQLFFPIWIWIRNQVSTILIRSWKARQKNGTTKEGYY